MSFLFGGGMFSGIGNILKIPKFADMLRDTFREILEEIWDLLDKGYKRAWEIIEFIFGIDLPDDIKDRASFTISIVAIIGVFFIAKTSYVAFTFSSGID